MIIESSASLNSRSNEKVRAKYLLPESIRESGENIIKLLQGYYDFINSNDQTSHTINTLQDYRNIDKTLEKYLDKLQLEIGITVPDTFTAERIKLFKKLVPWYVTKGSRDSIELFFRIIFSENPEFYYPKDDLLIPSQGKWNSTNQLYENRDGFLSDIKISRFSYRKAYINC